MKRHLEKSILHLFITFTSICIVLSVWQSVLAQDLRSAPIYEPDNPAPLSHPDIDRWSYFPEGLHGAVGSIDKRYDRDRVPMFNGSKSWSGVCWRGETIALQVVLWTNTAARQVRIEPSPLINDKKETIAAKNIRARSVRYVLSDDHFYGCSANTQEKPPILVADILENVTYFDMVANSTRPVWVTIQIPAATYPGTYRGAITVRAADALDIVFKISIDVLSLQLPPSSEWAFTLDLWQNPWAVARYHDVKQWSEEHILLLKPLIKMLADAGQKFITTTIIHHPWNAQTYDPYGSMVEWILGKDGRWSFDYSIFDRYVELNMENGIDRYISCYSMICFRNNAFRYYDAASGNYKHLYAEPGSEAYKLHWRPFLEDFSAHLRQKGWLNKTLIAMDERPYELMKEIIDFIRDVSPDLKINLASEDWQEQLQDRIFSYSVSLGRYTRPEIIEDRRRNGFISTFYTCCVEPRPNNFPHSGPAESAWMGWMAAADGFSGFLRWAYNSWPENPLYDTRYSQWNAGDCFLVYPGARSSIRFERLRDGIQDYEKIRLMREKLARLKDGKSAEMSLRLERSLSEYSYQSAQDTPCADIVNKSKNLLNELSIYLSDK